MPQDIPLACACGKLKGVARGVGRRRVNRVICYCKYCQGYARHLGHEAVLDGDGGTDIWQLSPRRLAFTEGVEHLACLRLTSKGPLRWYAGCCRAPIANTLATSRLPFVGLVHSAIDRNAEPRPLDQLLGPVRARLNRPPAMTGVNWRLFPMLGRYGSMLLFWWLRRDQKHSPFFDNGKLVHAPERVRLPVDG